ncbi:MAG: hypothetical protein KIS94_02045 [Chitinophagales bacterium]|nr:hypothetical protein [Chitinophagales bacterium]
MQDQLSQTITIHLEFTLRQLLAVLLCLVFVGYIGWEIYWYKKIGLYFIKWHTHLVATGIMGGVLCLPVWLFHRSRNSVRSEKLLTIASSVWFTFLLLESFLILTGWKKEYTEKRFGYYQSPFLYDSMNYYHVYHKGEKIENGASEFTYEISINSLGYPGQEWATEKPSGKVRIMTLGDSFTEGDGAPQDSSFPVLLQQMLEADFATEVLNAGVSGSDPVSGFKNLKERLAPYQPDIVIQMVSENDVLYDFCIRGGFERYVNDSVVKYNPPPTWEPFYVLSYTARIFFHAFGYDMKQPCGKPDNPAIAAKRNMLLKEIFDRYNRLASENNFKTIIVFYPTKYEFYSSGYYFDFSEAMRYANSLKNVSGVSLLPCYMDNVKEGKAKPKDFYWEIDGHHNATGYRMMAQCIAAQLIPYLQKQPKSSVAE